MLASLEIPVNEIIEIKNIPNGIEKESSENKNEDVNLAKNNSNPIQSRYIENNHNNYNKPSVSNISKKKINIKDFEKVLELGRGAYAKVDLRKSKINNKLFAIKILNKHFMEKLNKTHEAYIEKEIITMLDHPNIIKLLSTFQDKNKLYYVLEYASNRDLSSFISSQGALSYNIAKFYIAEIINALEYLNSKKIAHRDLKPENMILTSDMHLKIVNYDLN